MAFEEEYGIELVTSEIQEKIDIDLISSEMVGTVDGIFCIEDDMVDELLQTVCAYADEVGIPVIGIDQSQIEKGCLLAWADGELYTNEEKADKLGLDLSVLE